MAAIKPFKLGTLAAQETDRIKDWETNDFLALEHGGLGGSPSTALAACVLIDAPNITAQRNKNNGYPGLNASGKVDRAQMDLGVVYLDAASLFTAGRKQTFRSDATTAGMRLFPVSGDPSAPVDGDLWYDSGTTRFRKRENGASSDLSAPTPAGTDTHVQFNDASALGGVADFTFNKGTRRLAVGSGANHGMVNVNPAAGDPISPANGDIWYDSTAVKFRKREGGISSDLAVAGTPGGADTQVQYRAAGAFSGHAGLTFDPGAGSAQRLTVGFDGAGPAQHGILRVYPAIGDISTPVSGDIWYDVTTDKFRKREGAVSSDLGGAGGSPGGSATQVQYHAGGFGGDAAFVFDAGNERMSLGADTHGVLRLIGLPGDVGSPLDGDLFHNTTTDRIRAELASGTVDLLDSSEANVASGYGSLDALAMLPVDNQRPREWDKHLYSIQATRSSLQLQTSGLRNLPVVQGLQAVDDNNSGIWTKFTSGASINSKAGLHDGNFEEFRAAWKPDVTFRVKTGGSIADTLIWIGLVNWLPFDETDPTYKQMAAFRFDSAQDTTPANKWATYSGDGSITVEENTQVSAIAINSIYHMRVVCDVLGSSVKFYIDDVEVADHTTTFPANDANLGYVAVVISKAAASKEILFARMFAQTV